MEEFLSKDGSVTILLFCFLLTLTIVFHILGFWKSYREYSRKQEVNPEKPDVPLNKNDAFQKVQKRRVQEKR